uniref:Semaphorin 4G n=1 Tax=Tetraodon nigroviridis TaxID=99883 RepID=H3CTC4_TETNG
RRFRSPAVNYSTVLLEAESQRLYVGARGAVFALNASDISASSALTIEWEASPEQKHQCLLKGKDNKTECFNHIRFLQRFNSTHLYTCGTHAFRPLCAYIREEDFVMSSQPEEGRDKCPYGPTTGHTGLIVDQQIYTASQYEFRSFPDIRRNSPSPTLRTEDAPTRWLNEADFVGSSLVRESVDSSTGDDDKLYFFFTERSQERTTTYSQGRVAAVARVCKGDRGGRLTLQKRWTSFLKARLLCYLHEYDFHFNMLRSVFVLHGQTPQDTLFYGIFGLEWKNVKASAVCRYSLSAVQEAFEGPYMEMQGSRSEWKDYAGKIPEPRPGTCITDALRARGLNTSTALPDDVLNFVRRHPLMAQQVLPSYRQPVLFSRTTHYTHMAVQTTRGLDGRVYHVLYVATDQGWLHKAVDVGGQLHIIEELQAFEQEPINNVVISEKQMSVYLTSPSGVVQLPLSSCQRYVSCYDCIFARDPHCAWNQTQCVEITSHANRSTLIQDIQLGNRGCVNTQKGMKKSRLLHLEKAVRVGDDALLQCELSSNLANPLWTLDGSQLQGYGLNSGYRTGTDGLLIIEAQLEQSGLYTCYAVENDVQVAVVSYRILVHQDPPLTPDVGGNENLEAIYLSLVTILGSLCVVLAVVLVYVGCCLKPEKRNNRKQKQHRSSSLMELKTISSHCNGNGVCNGGSKLLNGGLHDAGFLQIVPGGGHQTPSKEPPPPAPPLPPTPQLSSPECDFSGGLSATLPSVLRRMNGNSYVLLRQSDSESASPLCYSFAEELNRILEKRKHTQLLPRPDESSV